MHEKRVLWCAFDVSILLLRVGICRAAESETWPEEDRGHGDDLCAYE